MVSQATLWQQYMQALSTKIQLGTGEALQVIYPYTTWNWGDVSPIPGSFSYEEWMTLNVVPANPGENSNSSAAASQSGFNQAYSNWMNTLAIGDLAKDANYLSLQQSYNSALAKYTTDYQNAKNVWMNQTGGTGVNMDAWLADPAQFGISKQVDQDKQDATMKGKELNDYALRIAGPVNDIVTAYNNMGYQGQVTDPNSGKSIPVRLWNTDPATPYAYVETITNNNFGGNATAGKADSTTFDTSTTEYTNTQAYGDGGGAVFGDFITIEASGSSSSIDWTNFQEQYKVSIAWEDLGTVDITPEGWYDGTNVTSYGEGPYATGFSAFNTGSGNYFFGPGGALSRIYTKMIVAYRPTITIDASSDFSTYLYQQWQSEGGIEIGPFFFGGSSGGSSESSTATVENGQLIIQSMSNWPLVVGMVSAWTLAPQP